jgi:hypothetical protein
MEITSLPGIGLWRYSGVLALLPDGAGDGAQGNRVRLIAEIGDLPLISALYAMRSGFRGGMTTVIGRRMRKVR